MSKIKAVAATAASGLGARNWRRLCEFNCHFVCLLLGFSLLSEATLQQHIQQQSQLSYNNYNNDLQVSSGRQIEAQNERIASSFESSVNRFRRSQLSEKDRQQRRPGSPLNITHSDIIVLPNGKVAVSISWLPPHTTSNCHTVANYKIIWSKRWTTSHDSDHLSVKQHHDVVDGNVTSTAITSLERDASYHIQVQAVCYSDTQQLLHGRKAGVHVSTHLRPPSAHRRVASDISNVINNHVLTAAPSIGTIRTEVPFFERGLLKANITWAYNTTDAIDCCQACSQSSPLAAFCENVRSLSMWSFTITGKATHYIRHALFVASKATDNKTGLYVDRVQVTWSPDWCSVQQMEPGVSLIISAVTTESYFVAYDLRFDCHYTIKIQPITVHGVVGPTSVTSLMTPSCSNVRLVDNSKPGCFNAANSRLIEEPTNLQYFFIINGTNMAANVSWSAPFSDISIIGYQVIWNQLQSGGTRTPTYSRTVSKETRSVNIGGLQEMTTYAVHVQGMSITRPGQNASLQFTTPRLSPNIVNLLTTTASTASPLMMSTSNLDAELNFDTEPEANTMDDDDFGGAFPTNSLNRDVINYILIKPVTSPEYVLLSSSSSSSLTAAASSGGFPNCLFVLITLTACLIFSTFS